MPSKGDGHQEEAHRIRHTGACGFLRYAAHEDSHFPFASMWPPTACLTAMINFRLPTRRDPARWQSPGSETAGTTSAFGSRQPAFRRRGTAALRLQAHCLAWYALQREALAGAGVSRKWARTSPACASVDRRRCHSRLPLAHLQVSCGSRALALSPDRAEAAARRPTLGGLENANSSQGTPPRSPNYRGSRPHHRDWGRDVAASIVDHPRTIRDGPRRSEAILSVFDHARMVGCA